MNFFTIFHFEQGNQEEPQTAKTERMIHGSELTCVNEESKPETEVDGT